jgi:cobalamin biosynthesis protein CobT
MGGSNSQPAENISSNYMTSEQVKANIREMFRLNQTNNVSPFSIDTIGFNAKLNGANTEEQTGGQTFVSRVNRYDAVLNELGVAPQQSEDMNVTFSSDKFKELSPKMEELATLRNMIASKSNQSGGCGGACGGDIAYSATSPNAIDYSVLKGGNNEEHTDDNKKDDKKDDKTDDKKDDKHKKKKNGMDESEDDESVDLDEDDDEDFEEDDDDEHEMSRIMDDSSESSSSDSSSDSSNSSSTSTSSSSSEAPKKSNNLKRHSASVERKSDDIKAVAFYSSEDASEHMRRLKRKNRF